MVRSCHSIRTFLRKRERWPRSQFRTKWDEIVNRKHALRHLKQSLASEYVEPDRRENADENHILSYLLHSFRVHKCQPTPLAYRFVLRVLSETSRIDCIPSVLDRLQKVEIFEVPEYIFTDIIRVYGNFGKIPEAINVFCRIPKFRCQPSAYSLNVLLSILCRNRESLEVVNHALSIARDMKIRLDESTFQILIAALCRIGEVSHGIELMNFMINDGFTVNSRLFSRLLNSLCKLRNPPEIDILQLLEESRRGGLCPSVRDYTNVMKFFINRGRGKDALCVLDRMKCDGVKPDTVCYTLALSGAIAGEEYRSADELFDELLVFGLVPDVYTYNVYINGLCKQVKIEAALHMFSCMKNLGCEPNVITYNILMKALVNDGGLTRAVELWKEMERNDVGKNSYTYQIMIHGFIDRGETTTFFNLLDEAWARPDVVGGLEMDELLCKLCGLGLVDKAIDLLYKMIDIGVSPGLRGWESLVFYSKSEPGHSEHFDGITEWKD